jgi:hypothetical protein
MMTVGHQERAMICLNRVLNPSWYKEIGRGRMGEGERTDVSNDSKTIWSVYAINANHIFATDIRAD